MASSAVAGIVDQIVSVANHYGIDPRLAVVDAYVESDLDPTAVGGDGTSFGLYQLQEGGELGSHTSAWAFNPLNNANTALGVFAATQKTMPGTDPGWLAADSQRPANPTAYAAKVDQLYNDTSFLPGVTPTSKGSVAFGGLTAIAQPAGGPATTSTIVSSGGGLLSGLGTSLLGIGVSLVLVAAGAGLAVLGVKKTADPSRPVPNPIGAL